MMSELLIIHRFHSRRISVPFQSLSFLRVAQVQEMELPVQIAPNTPFVKSNREKKKKKKRKSRQKKKKKDNVGLKQGPTGNSWECLKSLTK